MTTIINLPDDASAKAGTCGSCQFFKRYDSAAFGRGACSFRFPRQVQEIGCNENVSEPCACYDTNSCDLYRARTDVRFTQKISWTVPKEGK